MKCNSCGTEISNDNSFCPNCGTKTSSIDDEIKRNKARPFAAISFIFSLLLLGQFFSFTFKSDLDVIISFFFLFSGGLIMGVISVVCGYISINIKENVLGALGIIITFLTYIAFFVFNIIF